MSENMAALPRRRSWWRYFFVFYFALLVLSHFERYGTQNLPHARANQETARLQAVRGDQTLASQVTLAYRDLVPPDLPNPPVVLLLHGCPGASETFNRFAPVLAESCRVLIPDLPGFRGSSWHIPDYSIHAHAQYLVQLLERLHIEKVHVVGYSQGGGVAIELTRLAPARVQSLSLISAIGVQEMELLGDYHLNHAVHGAQLVFLWLLQEGFPHFGYMDDAYLNVSYARCFFDSDQRPLRGILRHYAGPLLILHGKNDPLVPLAAALEHYRVVPQSELRLFAGGHELVFTREGVLVPVVHGFVQRVERGEAKTLAQADAERVARARAPFDPATVPKPQGITLVTMLFMLALATLVSEDLTCLSAGLLVSHGTLKFIPAATACFLGIWGGDLLLYLAGKLLGQPMLARPPLRWLVKPEELARAKAWFEEKGGKVVFLSRFLPGSRLPTYVAAGLAGMSFWKFLIYLFAAAVLWTPALVFMASWLGQPMQELFSLYGRYALPAFVLTVLVLWLLLHLVPRLFSYRGRRMLLSWWRRKTRWEFWPPWCFYPPVVCYCLGQALKHRSLTLFTAANPGIFAGGFIGESKFEILQKLGEGNGLVACSQLLQGEEWQAKLHQTQAFMQQLDLEFPIVLKPDIGQRGAGVAIVRTPAQMENYFRLAKFDVIAQEYVPGHEFGVFYYRFPQAESGDIFAITDKRFPTVIGDGESTLTELILRDERAMCMASFFLQQHRARAQEVLAPGEPLQLVELGTHCRGALFLDGTAMKTPALVKAMDQMSKAFRGFYFGRYDIRTPALEDFKHGCNFKVVELNGVTSEATNIYDPRHGLFTAYRMLFQQWHLAFDIAAQNRAAGAVPVSLLTLIRALLRYKSAFS